MKTKLALAALCLAAGAVGAEQTVTVRDGATVAVRASKNEPTRIRVAGARIRDVVGNIYSSSCPRPGSGGAASAGAVESGPVNAQGDFVLGCDVAKGEVYLRPVGSSDKPFSVFVSTDAATYTLKVERADMAADTVVLQDQSPPGRRPRAGPTGRQAAHVAAIKQILLRLAGERDAGDAEVDLVAAPVFLWNEARLVQQRQLRWRGLLGEHYVLTNVATSPIVVAEQEFDRSDGGVVGVAVQRHNLLPGQSSAVYVIRQED